MRTLEEVRLLTGLETEKSKMLNIILVGQPELNDVLNSPHLEQLAQRVRLRFHITALSPGETREYIYHRLAVVGGDGAKLFPESTMPLIYKYTGGVPRLINILCDTSLLNAFVREEPAVDEEALQEAIEELQWVPFNERTHARQIDFEADTGSHDTEGKPKLVLTLNGSVLDEFPISKRIMTIGRKSDNDIQLDSGIVSRHHAQVKMVGKHCQLLDLNSRNGTTVNGQSIQKVDLHSGDEIAIGEHKLTFVAATEDDARVSVEDGTGEHKEIDLTDTIKVP
jgi:hypothetical protein